MARVYAGFWEGVVADNKAPETEPPGSVKVRIPEIHGDITEISDAMLPWAWPNLMFAGPQCGLVGGPPVNAIVNIIFKHGDKRFPMWIGGGFRTGEVPAAYLAGKSGLEPKTWLWLTPGGYGIIFDEMAKVVTLRAPQPSLAKVVLDVTSKKVTIFGDTGSKIELDDTAKTVLVQSLAGNKLSIDDTSQIISLEGASGQKLELNESTGQVQLKGTAKAILTAALMEIGVGATEAAVLGTAFMTLFNAHTHTYFPGPLAQAPTSPPVIPMVAGLHTSVVTKLK